MIFSGIDGCKAGWINFEIDDAGQWQSYVAESFRLCVEKSRAEYFFVDMPIGLSSNEASRECDREVRNILPAGKKSSVFNPPVQEAIDTNCYEEASRINFEKTGKKLSKQTWNIVPKIRELDNFLQKNIAISRLFYESHPETTFYRLNNSVPLTHNKRTVPGQNERLRILKQLEPNAATIAQTILDNSRRKDFKPDDLYDAMVLAIAAKNYFPHKFQKLPEQTIYNKNGLRQQVWVVR